MMSKFVSLYEHMKPRVIPRARDSAGSARNGSAGDNRLVHDANMAEILIAPMTAEYAADILSWRYPAPYDYYDAAGGDPGYYLDPANGVYAVLSGGELIGFRSFGPDGRVPGGVYDDSALDTGGGLRPALTGRGRGRSAIAAGLEFGRERFAPEAF